MAELKQIQRSRMIDGRVLSNEALTQRLYALRVEVGTSHFEAGQFARLELLINGEKVARPYSLVSISGDPIEEFFYNTVPNGQLSNALAELRKDDIVGVSQPPTGFFVLDGVPDARDLWLIATGTGLGPYLSLLRTRQLWERFENVVLVHGVPYCEELVYQGVINPLQLLHPERFKYISCVSREGNPTGLSGRITEALGSGQLETLAGIRISKSTSSIMLCGNHSMINDMQALLSERGLQKHLRHKPGQIITEQYF
jgi:ferredoxin--NADP+ reductase